MTLLDFLKLPEGRQIKDIDAPSTTEIHSSIIKKKVFLRKIYEDFYTKFRLSLWSDLENRIVVELGSGGGFIKEFIPSVITSDVIEAGGVDRIFSALSMPFENHSISAFLMIDVLHHINNTEQCFCEMQRCLKENGKILMIEPANTLWGRFIYQNFHHEPFDPNGNWGFQGSNPLSSANGAIPWIVFFRDRELFEKKFPNLTIKMIRHHTPFRYILSGGLSFKQLAPSWTYSAVKAIERLFSPLNRFISMFYFIELEYGKI